MEISYKTYAKLLWYFFQEWIGDIWYSISYDFGAYKHRLYLGFFARRDIIKLPFSRFEWRDTDNMIEETIKKLVIEFVEKETSLKEMKIQMKLSENIMYQEIINAYTFFKKEQPKLEKKIDNALKKSDTNLYYDLEKELYDKNTFHMQNVIASRGILWT